MAEGFMNFFLKDGGLHDAWVACSAGTMASAGQRASEYAVRVMSDFGVDISGHRSSSLSDWDPPDGTVFFGMTFPHKKELERVFPSRLSRIFLLGDAAGFSEGNREEVPDPYGFSLASYRQTAGRIREMIWSLYSSLVKNPGFLP